jgi:opacity protein-like surface antigen
MKFLVATVAALAAAGFAGAAFAQGSAENNYVQVNLGAGVAGKVDLSATIANVGSGSASEDAKAGFFGSVLYGRRLGHGVSVEAEAYYGVDSIDTADLNAVIGAALHARTQSYGALANLKLEAPQPFKLGEIGVEPYVAGGVGYGGAKYRVAGISDSKGGFTWQVKAGLAFPMSNGVTWDLGYRYLTAAKYSFNDGAGDSFSARAHLHAVTAGARFSF